MGDFRRTKMNWTKPSVNKMLSSKAMTEAYNNGTLNIKSPWEQQDEDAMEEFDRNLAAMEVRVERPWDERSTELRAQENQRIAASNYKMKSLFDEDPAIARKQEQQKQAAQEYKFKSMFEVPPLTEKQQKVIDEYEMNPPFRTSYNQVPEDKRTAKKLAPNKNPITRQPWTYGSMPADPIPKKIFDKPPTGLWSVPPKQDDSANELPSSGDPILDSLRVQLKKQGAAGIAGLSRKFRIMDDDQSGTLSMQEFIKGMKECKVADLTDKALKHLFLFFDKDDSGVISYDEFLVGVRGVLNERRKQLVRLAFRVLDRDGSGQVEMNDIKGVYNASSHPDVIMNKRTEEEVLVEFMQAFQTGRDKDAIITKEEFECYYANLSASIDSDDYFELMLRNAWHISGGEGWCANTTNRRLLVTHADGRQTVEEIKNDMGLRADDKKGMVERLKAQGLKMASINTNGLGDMGNQYEDPDFTKYRQELAAQQGTQVQEQGSEHSSRGSARSSQQGSGAQARNSLANFATAGAGANAGATRPATRAGPGASVTGPRTLADFATSGSIGALAMEGGPGSAYNAPVSAYKMQARPASAAPVVSKPTSLANYVNNGSNNNTSGSGGNSARQRY